MVDKAYQKAAQIVRESARQEQLSPLAQFRLFTAAELRDLAKQFMSLVNILQGEPCICSALKDGVHFHDCPQIRGAEILNDIREKPKETQ